jgi:hypothetical protein
VTVSVPPSVNANSTVICLYFNRLAAAIGSGRFAVFFLFAIYLFLHINIPFSIAPNSSKDKSPPEEPALSNVEGASTILICLPRETVKRYLTGVFLHFTF